MNQLKKIRRAAGAVRDVDVQKKLVDSFESQESARGRAFVRAKLDLMRGHSEKKLIQLLSPKGLEELDRMLGQCERKLGKHFDGGDVIAKALEQYLSLTCRFEPLGRENIHEFRKACKHVRYLAELAPDSAMKKGVVDALKQIQDSVGEWHDIVTLREVGQSALKAPKQSIFIRELEDAEEKKFRETLLACKNAKQELIRLEAEQLTAQRKQQAA